MNAISEPDPELWKVWRQRRTARTFYHSLTLTDRGVVWGAGTMMIARRGDNDANLAVERDHARAMALAAVVSRGICPDLITHFQKAEKHRQAGNHARAQIHLAFARLPRLGEADAFRLFLADEFLRQGFTPSLLLKELGFSDKDVALLKFPGQQHIPAGTDRRRFKRWRRQLRGWAERSAWRKRPG